MMRKAAAFVTLAVLAGTPGFADSVAAGNALFQQGRYAEAEAEFRKDASVNSQAWLALALAKQKKHDDAVGVAGGVLSKQTDQAIAVQALGEALVGAGKYDVAIDRMTQALGASKTLAYAYYWRGQAYQNKRQPDRMVGDFESFLKLLPQAPEAPAVRQFLASLR